MNQEIQKINNDEFDSEVKHVIGFTMPNEDEGDDECEDL